MYSDTAPSTASASNARPRRPRVAALPCQVRLAGLRVASAEEAEEILRGVLGAGLIVTTAEGIKLKITV
jgi:hypothetical protein